MSATHDVSVAALAVFTALTASLALGSITIPTVPIGNPGNAAEPNTLGSVAYTYNIGQTEVTNAQYATFLNAVAATDTHNLFNEIMAKSPYGGISRAGVSGSYAYSTISGRENHPVNFVSFWDATRFANWLHNGQPSGAQNASTTEDGAYTLTPDGISANTITRNATWQWAVTSEDEWYKAAYHQPASQGGDSDSYWLFPTSSNTITVAHANYDGVIGNTTPVGSYTANFYGTFDMGGNVSEWNEAITFSPTQSLRGVLGGSLFDDVLILRANNSERFQPASSEDARIGFRVSQVPGPSSLGLLAVAGLVSKGRRR